MKAPLRFCILALWLFAPALVPTGAVLQADDRFGNRETTRVIQTQAVTAIANLADPAKLATLGERGAIPRVKKITYWLLAGQNVGAQPAAVIDAAFEQFGWKGTRAATPLEPRRTSSQISKVRPFPHCEPRNQASP